MKYFSLILIVLIHNSYSQSCTNCQNGKCLIVNGQSTCVCSYGYFGDSCEFTDPCLTKPCRGGACFPQVINNRPDYYCSCYTAFSGTNCEIGIDNPCAGNPCLNNGICDIDYTKPGAFMCLCPAGYFGQKCETYLSACAGNQCQNNGICIPNAQNTNYTCKCQPGFFGEFCEIEKNECASNPCKFNSTCYDLIDGYICKCRPNFVGSDCSTYVNPCNSNPCGGNSVCQANNDSYVCACRPGFFGNSCKPNPCNSNPCRNTDPGACIPIDGDDSTCTCAGQITTTTYPIYTCLCKNGFPTYASPVC